MKPVWALINAHDRELVPDHASSRLGRFPAAKTPALALTPPGILTTPTAYSTSATYRRNARHSDCRRTRSICSSTSTATAIRTASACSRMRPAPVIIGWFNMYATTAMPCFDYLIGDRHVVAPDEEAHYSERIVRVPGSYLTFDVGYRVPDVAPPPCVAERPPHVRLALLALQDHARRNPRLERDSPAAAQTRGCSCATPDLDNDIGTRIPACAIRAAWHRPLARRARSAEPTHFRVPRVLLANRYRARHLSLQRRHDHDRSHLARRAGRRFCRHHLGLAHQHHPSSREGGLGDWVATDLNGYIELAVRWGS